jgi:L-seryl-tRNA(Ser) seleniumtransferase
MLTAQSASIAERADAVATALTAGRVECRVVQASGAVGGGTFPEVELPSWAVELSGAPPDVLARALRDGDPAVVGRIVDDHVLLDLRTVLPGQEDDLVRRVCEAHTRTTSQ